MNRSVYSQKSNSWDKYQEEFDIETGIRSIKMRLNKEIIINKERERKLTEIKKK
jgi:hypothetical protein